jgi:DNA-binding CsgD family transcriptional regulator
MHLFDLTPAEARLAVGLAQGATFADLAVRFGVSENTLKTQLAQVFLKTETASQRDLMRRLSLIPPLR